MAPRDGRRERFAAQAQAAGHTAESLEKQEAELDDVLHLRPLAPQTAKSHERIIDYVATYLDTFEADAGKKMLETATVDPRLSQLKTLKAVLHFIVTLTKPKRKKKTGTSSNDKP